MIKISTHYNHKISSQMLNDRVSDLMGGNTINSGFRVTKVSDFRVSISPGKCLINGAIIESDEDIELDIVDKCYITLIYNHRDKSVNLNALSEKNNNDNALLLATIDFNNVITTIKEEPVILSQMELSKKLSLLKNEVESSVNGESTMVGMVQSNNTRINNLEQLIDNLLYPAIIDTDYALVKLGINYATGRLNK